MNDDDQVRALPLALAMGSSGVVAALATGGEPINTVAAAGVPLVVQAAVAIKSRWVSKSTKAIDVAADALDVGVDIVLSRSIEYEDRLELLTRVIEASARSTIPEKVRALGLVLADGLGEDRASTAEALVIARALEVLEAPHVVVLSYISEHPRPDPGMLHPAVLGTAGWQVHLLATVLPNLAGVMDSLVSALSGTGLLYDVTGANYASAPGPACWNVTAIGFRCLNLLETDHT